MTSGNYVTVLLIEEERRINHQLIGSPSKAYKRIGTVATSAEGNRQRTNISQSPNTTRAMKCYSCGKLGQIAYNCQTRDRRPSSIYVTHSLAYRSSSENRKVTACSVNESADNRSWLDSHGSNEATIAVDCGATKHAVNNSAYFKEAGEIEHVQITIAD